MQSMLTGGRHFGIIREITTASTVFPPELLYNAFMDKRIKIVDPTEAQIAAACARLRTSWSPLEHYRRSVSAASELNAARASVASDRWYEPVVFAPSTD